MRLSRTLCSTSASAPRVGCVVAGAGVVGLACAKVIAESGIETIIIERADILGSGISSRNSEVIHAGLYYKKGSLKGRLCLDGRDKLYNFADTRSIPHQKCGKLVVATSEAEVPTLLKLHELAIKNGVHDLKLLDSAEARTYEPEVTCTKALFSPSTGIIDSHSYMQQLLADAENAGASCIYMCEIEGGTSTPEGINLETTQGPILTKVFINAAGLHSIQLAHRISGLNKSRIPQSFFAKGNYFKLDTSVAKKPFSRLVYPVPEVGGLGIHATIDLSGAVKFGPDVEWMQAAHDVDDNSSVTPTLPPEGKSIDQSQHQSQHQQQAQLHTPQHEVPENFTVDPRRADMFYAAIRNYWPGLPDNSLVPDYSGIRPKLLLPKHLRVHKSQKIEAHSHSTASITPEAFQESQLEDFIIDGPEEHGVPGLVNLFGIESPGLTASLAIAQLVSEIVNRQK